MGQQPQTTTVSEIYGIGPANVNWKDSWLGATKGGVTAQITATKYRRTIDAYGDTPIGKCELATNIIVTVPLLQETTVRLAHLADSGTLDSTKITFGRYVGREDTGHRLILQPYDDRAHDIILYNTVPEIDWSLVYSVDSERVYPVKFEGMIDESRSDGDKLFRLDESYSI